MIQDRQPDDLRYGDVCIWTATGQEVTVMNPHDKYVVGVVDRGVIKFVPRRHLRLRVPAEDNLAMFDDWLEDKYGDPEAY